MVKDYTEEELEAMTDEELEAAVRAINTSSDEPTEEVDLESTDDELPEEEPTEEDNSDEVVEDTTDDAVEDAADDEEQSDDDGDEDESSDESEEEPTEESDDNATEDKTDDKDSEEAKKEEDSNPEKADQPEAPVIHKVKANGKNYDFTSEELVEMFPKVFGQAMDYTRKMKAIKPHRKTIDALQEAKISPEDLNLLIEAHQGKQGAINTLLKRNGIDALDLDPETTEDYAPKDYGKSHEELAVRDVIETISADLEYEKTQNIMAKQWDEESWQSFTKNPTLISLLHNDVKSGIYDEVQPNAEKLKLLDGGTKSDLEYYRIAGNQYHDRKALEVAAEQVNSKLEEEKAAKQQEQQRLEKVKADAQKRADTKKAASKRTAATLPKKASKADQAPIDYLKMSDEEFEKLYNKIMD